MKIAVIRLILISTVAVGALSLPLKADGAALYGEGPAVPK